MALDSFDEFDKRNHNGTIQIHFMIAILTRRTELDLVAIERRTFSEGYRSTTRDFGADPRRSRFEAQPNN
jgi:hypothetical protein